jgi:lysophospholipase L1-like esterase
MHGTKQYIGGIDPSEFRLFILCAIPVLLALFTPAMQAAAPADRWVGTWATASVAGDNSTTKPGELKIGTEDVKVREVVHTSMGGDAIRLVLTNEFGTTPLKVGAVEVGISSGSSSDGVTAGSAHAVTFGRQTSLLIPAGAKAISDPVALPLAAQTNLAISLYVPRQTLPQLSLHGFANTTNFIAKGNQTAATMLTGPKTMMTSWYLLKAVDVATKVKNAAAIVTLGDSITDGDWSTPDANARWPDVLAARLQANSKTRHLSVLNMGIGANRILHDAGGTNVLSRFDRDVLGQDGVKYLVILEGVNDIGHSTDSVTPGDVVTADELIWAMTQLVERAHAHGIKVLGATLTPFEGAKYTSPEGQQIRQALNTWILTGGVVDGVIDFAKATQDTAKPTWFLPTYEHGDHLHPNDAGYKVMGNSIDLSLFK